MMSRTLLYLNKFIGYTGTSIFFHDCIFIPRRFFRKEVYDKLIFSSLSVMPKEEMPVVLRQNRLKKFKHGLPPTVAYFTVLGNGADGVPRSLYLFTDHTSYLFNCGEGTQRLASEYKLRLDKLKHIFVTSKSWENIGGLTGMMFTLQEIGLKYIYLHGPPFIEKLQSMVNEFEILMKLKINKRNSTDKIYSDNCLDVTYIPLFDDSVSCTEDSVNILPDSDNGISNDCSVHQTLKHQKLSSSEGTIQSVAFICKLANKPGHLVLEKCVDFGVEAGSLLGKLKCGEDVTLSDGRIVRSKDVVTEEEIGPVFIVLECPTEESVDFLLKEQRFLSYQNPSEEIDAPLVIFHFTPPHILQSKRYQEWMESFPECTKHIVLNSLNNTFCSLSVNAAQHKLYLIHPDIFPLLKSSPYKDVLDTNSQIIQSDCSLRFHLRPEKGIELNSEFVFDPESSLKEATDLPCFQECLEKLQNQLEEMKSRCLSNDIYPEVVFLGTGCSAPRELRNVSAILVNLSEENSMLLDSGEGTYGQLYHFYGPDEVEEVLRKISCIFISHNHADHYLGLVQVLLKRKATFDKFGLPYSPVDIILPKPLMRWISVFNYTYKPIVHLFRVVPSEKVLFKNRTLFDSEYEEFLAKHGLTELITVPVIHIGFSYGIVLSTADFKLVYSGDTMPCDSLIAQGQNCDLLIHEASMEDYLEGKAQLTRHSTTSQAIDVGIKMNARHTILTHFSQKYANVALFNEKFHSTVGCAFDNMKVQRRHLPVLPALIPSLKCLRFELLEDRKVKRHTQEYHVEKLASEALTQS